MASVYGVRSFTVKRDYGIGRQKLKIADICRDAADDNIIACAVSAKADYLVTGDADLLVIRSYQGIKIVTPRDFEALFL